MRIKLVSRVNPINRDDEPKYYAQMENQGVVELKDLSQQITTYSSLSSGDILNVLENMVDASLLFLLMGKAVRLGNLGMLRIVLKGKGVSNPKDFSCNLIDHAKIRFIPSVKFKRGLEGITYER